MNFVDFLNGKSAETYFDEKIKECKFYDELPGELKNCTCCQRHRIDFPVLGRKLVPTKNNYNLNYSTDSVEKTCECPCRHIARHICRRWDLIHEVEDISTNDSDKSEEDSSGSLEDFIVYDEGFSKKERKTLDKALKNFRGKKKLRR